MCRRSRPSPSLSVRVCTTAWVAGSTTVTVLASALVTSSRAPSGVTATLLGRPGIATVAMRWSVAVSMATSTLASGTTLQTCLPSGVVTIGAELLAERWVATPESASSSSLFAVAGTVIATCVTP